MRKYYWYISTFIRKHGVIVLSSIVAAIIIFSLALPFVSKLIVFKNKQYIGVVGKYTFSALPPVIQSQISAGLTHIQEDGTPIPDLAERWNTEDDGKNYRFVIKKGILWQDGKELVPEDINYNFNDVKVISTANDVVFKLKTPFVPFPTVVAQPLLRTTDENFMFFFKKKRIVGIGQNQVLDYKESNNRLTEVVVEGPQTQYIYRFYLTELDALMAFKRGEVDILPDLTSPGDIQNWSTVQVNRTLDTRTYLGVFINTSYSFLSSNELRQALNYSVIKPTDETRAIGPIDPKSWAFADVGKTYDYDLDRAIDRLLAALPAFNEPMVFDLTTTPNFSSLADEIKKNWENLGVKAAEKCLQDNSIKDKKSCANLKMTVNVRISNYPDPNNFQTLLVGQTSSVDPDQYNLWHSQQQTNFTHYKNVRIDSLLEKGRQTEDRKKRFEVYQDFQQFFSEDEPVVFISHLYKYEVRRKGK
jgi:peptide/nickel transport system substrate-binding protein